MSNVDLHPDDLLDKELLGELSQPERTRLDAHLAVCSACRFERLARDDFRAEFTAESQRSKLTGMLTLALENAPTHDAAAPKPAIAKPAMLPSRRTRTAILLAAAVLVVSAVAGAGFSRVPHLFGVRGPSVDDHLTIHEAAPLASAARPLFHSTRAWLAPAATSAPAPAPVPSIETPAADVTPDPAPAPVPPAVTVRTASSIFTDANDARSRGDYASAIALYTDIESRYPRSPEALTTHAILGRLLLDRGDAAAALGHFDAYLAGGAGALREEAMVGRANALARLGRADDERAAWTSLLAAFPGSASAPHARDRIEALGGL